MQLELYRKNYYDDCTEGDLYIRETPESGLRYLCSTIEPTTRTLHTISDKVYGKTAIPPGTYQVMYQWSFKWKRKMPRVLNVPFFEGILIHPGNQPKDTMGCILVGQKTRDKYIATSKFIFERVCSLILNRGGHCTLMVRNASSYQG